MNNELIKAAQAVVDRWDSTDWKAAPTAEVMNRLRAALSGADLSRADLSGANLSRANLSGADLSGADMPRGDNAQQEETK